ncbi:hypothetical protein [Polynucleobacter arcticus]|nr:hypothetical protein [Polynucleobacter arcticus]
MNFDNTLLFTAIFVFSLMVTGLVLMVLEFRTIKKKDNEKS